MTAFDINNSNMRVFLNHIYELKKGVRRMALFTTKRVYKDYAIERLQSQNIDYVLQEVNGSNINIYFGSEECVEAVRVMINKPLNMLSPEEDFMLGAMLGYDICVQCKRYCERKAEEDAQLPAVSFGQGKNIGVA